MRTRTERSIANKIKISKGYSQINMPKVQGFRSSPPLKRAVTIVNKTAIVIEIKKSIGKKTCSILKRCSKGKVPPISLQMHSRKKEIFIMDLIVLPILFRPRCLLWARKPSRRAKSNRAEKRQASTSCFKRKKA